MSVSGWRDIGSIVFASSKKTYSNICRRRWIAMVIGCCSARANSVWLWPYRFRQTILTTLLVYDVHWHCWFWSAFRDHSTEVLRLHWHCRWRRQLRQPHWMTTVASLWAVLLWSANWNIDSDTSRNTANRYFWCRAEWKCAVSCKCRWNNSNRPTKRWILGDNRWMQCSCRLLRRFLWINWKTNKIVILVVRWGIYDRCKSLPLAIPCRHSRMSRSFPWHSFWSGSVVRHLRVLIRSPSSLQSDHSDHGLQPKNAVKWKIEISFMSMEVAEFQQVETYSHKLAFRMYRIQRCFHRNYCCINRWWWPDTLAFWFAFRHHSSLNMMTIRSNIPIHLMPEIEQICFRNQFHRNRWWGFSLTSAWMRVTRSWHFRIAFAVSFLFLARSRSELLAAAAICAARTPCAPIAPAEIFTSVASALARSICVTHSRLLFRQQHFHVARVRCIRSTREFETLLTITTIRSGAIVEPRRPRAHFLHFGTCVRVAFLPIHVAANARHSTMLWCRIVAMAPPETCSTATNCCTFTPGSPLAPAAIDRWQFYFRTRWQMLQKTIQLISVYWTKSFAVFYLTIQFVMLFAHTRSSAMRWFRVATRSASRLHGHSTRLRASRPRWPIGPTAIHRAIRNTGAHAFARQTSVARTGIVAGTCATQAAIMIARFGHVFIIRMLRAIVPFTPSWPTAIDCGRQQRTICSILKPICGKTFN